MDFAKTLKRLRRTADVTQEELAMYLGMSFQSVSKWERGDGFPDITHLPAIARYFKVSVDELLGTDTEIEKEQEEEYKKKHRNLRAKHDQEMLLSASPQSNTAKEIELEIIELLREAVKMFPDKWYFRLLLAEVLNKSSYFGFANSEAADEDTKTELQENEKYTAESLSIYEFISENCPELSIKNMALQSIVIIYSRLGQKDRAREYANQLVSMNATKEAVLPMLLEGSERETFLHQELLDSTLRFWTATRYLSRTLATSGHEFNARKSTDYSLDERCEIVELGIKALRLLDGVEGMEELIACGYYLIAMAVYADAQQHDKAFIYLHKAVDALQTKISDLPLLTENFALSKAVISGHQPLSAEAMLSHLMLVKNNENVRNALGGIEKDKRFEEIIDRLTEVIESGNSGT